MITMSLLSFGLLTACGDKEEDTAVVTDTADTEETDTEDTSDTEETDTEDTEDTSDTEDPDPVDADMDGFTDDVDCDDSNADINPDAFDNPENDVDEDCNGTAATVTNFDGGLINPSFEDVGDAWQNLGDTWQIYSSSDTIWGDDGDSGETVAAPDGDKFVKIWPDAGANLYGDESPVYQEWFAAEDNISDQTFYISALGMVHESSLLKGATEAVVLVKCFEIDSEGTYTSTGEGKSVALTADSTTNEWVHQSAVGTCGPGTSVVQAVLSLQTPDEDVDGNGTIDAGESQQTGNVYFDHVLFGVYSN